MNCETFTKSLNNQDDIFSLTSEMKAHIKSCDNCREIVEQEKEIITTMGTYKQDKQTLSEDFYKNLKNKIETEKCKSTNVVHPFFSSRLLAFGSAVAAVAVIFVLIFTNFDSSKNLSKGDNQQLTATNAKRNEIISDNKIAQLYSLIDQTGKVIIMKKNNEEGWKNTSRPEDYPKIGDSIQILAKASATLLFDEKSKIKLRENSFVKIHEKFIRLNSGSTWIMIHRKNKLPHPFTVKTPSAIIEVLGTCFEVTHDKKLGTTVKVNEGSVYVKNDSGYVVLKPGDLATVKSKKSNITIRKKSQTNISKKIIQKIKQVQTTQTPVIPDSSQEEKKIEENKEEQLENQGKIEEQVNSENLFK